MRSYHFVEEVTFNEAIDKLQINKEVGQEKTMGQQYKKLTEYGDLLAKIWCFIVFTTELPQQ